MQHVYTTKHDAHVHSLSTLHILPPHLGRVFYVVPEVGSGVVGWQQDLAVLLHQLGEVEKQWMLLTQEVKLVIPLHRTGKNSHAGLVEGV